MGAIKDMLGHLPRAKLEAIHRVAKTRLRPFFADPRAMKELRDLVAPPTPKPPSSARTKRHATDK